MQWMHYYYASLGCGRDFTLKLLWLRNFAFRYSTFQSWILIFFFTDHSLLMVVYHHDCISVARGDLCAHVSLRASLSLRSCFIIISIKIIFLPAKCMHSKVSDTQKYSKLDIFHRSRRSYLRFSKLGHFSTFNYGSNMLGKCRSHWWGGPYSITFISSVSQCIIL